MFPLINYQQTFTLLIACFFFCTTAGCTDTEATSGDGSLQEQNEATLVSSDTVNFYVVPAYDPQRDPAQDLAQVLTQTRTSGKRILIEVGGDWCTWCHALDRYIHDNEAVSEALRANFVVLKVNYSEENTNESFLSQYPEIPGYPHIFVLESTGELLHSQNTGDLEEGKSYSNEAFLSFLNKWSPPRS